MGARCCFTGVESGDMALYIFPWMEPSEYMRRAAPRHAMPCATGMPDARCPAKGHTSEKPKHHHNRDLDRRCARDIPGKPPRQQPLCMVPQPIPKTKKALRSGEPLVCAGSESRTRTPLLAYAPETYASTNSAIPAKDVSKAGAKIIGILLAAKKFSK